MDLKDKTIAALGDSVTKGFDGTVNLRYNYPRYLAKYYKCKVSNNGINGATIYETLEKEVEKLKKTQCDIIILMIGTNDYGHLDVPLVRIISKLTRLVRNIISQHHEAEIFAALPLPRFDNDKNASNVVRYSNYTFDELLDGIAEVYSAFQIPFIDWREYHPEFITDFNFKNMYQDQHVHPNAYTYRKLAVYVGDFIQNN